MKKDYIDPPDGMRLIRGVSFFDTPESESKEDLPYIPSASEWSKLKSDLKFLSWGVGFGIGVATVGFIFALCALVTK